MGPQAEDYIETVLTCEGDFYDPEFHAKLHTFRERLEEIISEGIQEKNALILKKVEPWNSVKVTFNIPKDAAVRLKSLAEEGDKKLKELGILSVQIEGDRTISLKIAGKNNETTELIFRTTNVSTSANSVFDLNTSEEIQSPRNVDNTRKNIAHYLGHQSEQHGKGGVNVLDFINQVSRSLSSVNPNLTQDILQPNSLVSGTVGRKVDYFQPMYTPSQVSPKFPTPPPSVSTPSSPSTKQTLGFTHPSFTQSNLMAYPAAMMNNVMTNLLNSKNSSTSPMLVNLLQNDVLAQATAAACAASGHAQALGKLAPVPSDNAPPPKKRKRRKPKEKDGKEVPSKTSKTDKETESVIHNILNKAVAEGRVPSLGNDSPRVANPGSSASLAPNVQYTDVPSTTAALVRGPRPSMNVSPNTRQIINPRTGQLEYVDDDSGCLSPSGLDNAAFHKSPRPRPQISPHQSSPVSFTHCNIQAGIPSTVHQRTIVTSVHSAPKDPFAFSDGVSLPDNMKNFAWGKALSSLAHGPNPSIVDDSHKLLHSKSSLEANAQPVSAISPVVSNIASTVSSTLFQRPMQNQHVNQTVHTSVSQRNQNVLLSETVLSFTQPVPTSDLIQTSRTFVSKSLDGVTGSQCIAPTSDTVVSVDVKITSNEQHVNVASVMSNCENFALGVNVATSQRDSGATTSITASDLHKPRQSPGLSSPGPATTCDSSVQSTPNTDSLALSKTVSKDPVSSLKDASVINHVVPVSQKEQGSVNQNSKSDVCETTEQVRNDLNRAQNHCTDGFAEKTVHINDISSNACDDPTKHGSVDSGLGDIKENNGESPCGSSGNESPGATNVSRALNINSSPQSGENKIVNMGSKNVLTVGYVLSQTETSATDSLSTKVLLHPKSEVVSLERDYLKTMKTLTSDQDSLPSLVKVNTLSDLKTKLPVGRDGGSVPSNQDYLTKSLNLSGRSDLNPGGVAVVETPMMNGDEPHLRSIPLSRKQQISHIAVSTAPKTHESSAGVTTSTTVSEEPNNTTVEVKTVKTKEPTVGRSYSTTPPCVTTQVTNSCSPSVTSVHLPKASSSNGPPQLLQSPSRSNEGATVTSLHPDNWHTMTTSLSMKPHQELVIVSPIKTVSKHPHLNGPVALSPRSSVEAYSMVSTATVDVSSFSGVANRLSNSLVAHADNVYKKDINAELKQRRAKTPEAFLSSFKTKETGIADVSKNIPSFVTPSTFTTIAPSIGTLPIILSQLKTSGSPSKMQTGMAGLSPSPIMSTGLPNLGPSPIMSTGLSYFNTSASRQVTPPPQESALDKGQKSASVVKSLHDKEPVEVGLPPVKGQVVTKLSPKKTEKTEKMTANQTPHLFIDKKALSETGKGTDLLNKTPVVSEAKRNLSKSPIPHSVQLSSGVLQTSPQGQARCELQSKESASNRDTGEIDTDESTVTVSKSNSVHSELATLNSDMTLNAPRIHMDLTESVQKVMNVVNTQAPSEIKIRTSSADSVPVSEHRKPPVSKSHFNSIGHDVLASKTGSDNLLIASAAAKRKIQNEVKDKKEPVSESNVPKVVETVLATTVYTTSISSKAETVLSHSSTNAVPESSSLTAEGKQMEGSKLSVACEHSYSAPQAEAIVATKKDSAREVLTKTGVSTPPKPKTPTSPLPDRCKIACDIDSNSNTHEIVENSLEFNKSKVPLKTYSMKSNEAVESKSENSTPLKSTNTDSCNSDTTNKTERKACSVLVTTKADTPSESKDSVFKNTLDKVADMKHATKVTHFVTKTTTVTAKESSKTVVISSGDSKETTNFSLDLRSAVTVVSSSKFIKHVSSNLKSKSETKPVDSEQRSVTATNKSTSSSTPLRRSSTVESQNGNGSKNEAKTEVDNAQDETSSNEATPQKIKRTLGRHSTDVPLTEQVESVRPARIRRRCSRSSNDSKTSSTDGGGRGEDYSPPIRISTRGRKKSLSESSETLDTIGSQSRRSSGASSRDRSVSPGPHNKRSSRQGRKKLESTSETPSSETSRGRSTPDVSPSDSSNARATRSSKRKMSNIDEKDTVASNENKRSRVDSSPSEQGKVEASTASSKDDVKGKGTPKSRSKTKPTQVETSSHSDTQEEKADSSSQKRSTRSTRSQDHCELPNAAPTKKKQKT